MYGLRTCSPADDDYDDYVFDDYGYGYYSADDTYATFDVKCCSAAAAQQCFSTSSIVIQQPQSQSQSVPRMSVAPAADAATAREQLPHEKAKKHALVSLGAKFSSLGDSSSSLFASVSSLVQEPVPAVSSTYSSYYMETYEASATTSATW